MIRYHSFYPWHCAGDYSYLCNDQDMEMLKWVKEFKWVLLSFFVKEEHFNTWYVQTVMWADAGISHLSTREIHEIEAKKCIWSTKQKRISVEAAWWPSRCFVVFGNPFCWHGCRLISSALKMFSGHSTRWVLKTWVSQFALSVVLRPSPPLCVFKRKRTISAETFENVGLSFWCEQQKPSFPKTLTSRLITVRSRRGSVVGVVI